MHPGTTEKGWFVRRLSVVLGCVAILTVTLLNVPAAQAASSAQTTLVVTWRPSLVVTIPASAPASTYSATITHSVA
jgi:hypothetical protein